MLRSVIAEQGEKVFMMCNEAMVRGALEADVKMVSFYPGSPTSEILDTFNSLQDQFDYRFNVCTNEKVALETAAGASMAGFRSLCSMKSVGMNVASDSFFSLGYTGVKAGMVIIMADDPHCHSSQSEQDGRLFAPAAHIPMLEPGNPAQALEMVKYAFDLSEEFRIPVLVRTTTRINHQSGIVELGDISRKPFKKGKWSEVKDLYFTVGEIARNNKVKALERISEIRKKFEEEPFNIMSSGEGSTCIIASGVGHSYAMDACQDLGLNIPVLRLATTYPIPEKKVLHLISGSKRVLVVEELFPYLEDTVKRIALDNDLDIEVLGKGSGHLSQALEYNVPIVSEALAKIFEKEMPLDYKGIQGRAEKLKSVLPKRIPLFCAGCPHRATFWSIKQAMRGRNVVYNDDIGCYTMAFFPPLNMSVSMLSMGASLGISAGMAQVLEDKIMCTVGDSTFFHAALPGLVNAVYHDLNLTLFILDNEVTAMTGQQAHPGTPRDRGLPEGKKRVDIEKVCKGIGVEFIRTMDSYDVRNNINIIREAFDYPGVSIIISKRACALHGDRIKRRTGEAIIPNEVDPNTCKKPHTCIKDFHCPAISFDPEKRTSVIDPSICDGCGVCARICPFGAIKPLDGNVKTQGVVI